jgi:hypothetical protein
MGKSSYMQTITHDYAAALDLANTAVVLFPSYPPALVVKAQILTSMRDWDGAQEAVTRCFTLDADAVQAHHIQVLLVGVASYVCTLVRVLMSCAMTTDSCKDWRL